MLKFLKIVYYIIIVISVFNMSPLMCRCYEILLSIITRKSRFYYINDWT